jgi:Tol biopolymer transport system component
MLVLLLVAAGCTREPERRLPQVDVGHATNGPSATSSPPRQTVAIDAPGLLAVVDDLGNILTLDPDGSNAVRLDEPVPNEIVVRQPTWSPDGGRLAWVRFAPDGEGANAIMTADPDGTAPTETTTTAIPFYLSWDPTSSRIAYLGSTSGDDIELGVAEAGGTRATPLGVGSPFYLSWGPSGEQLLVHVGADRLDRLELDGTTSPVEDRLGTFTAPVWTDDGAAFVYVSTASGGERLVAQEMEATHARELLRFDGTVVFVVSPDGRHIAYQVGHAPGDVEPLSVIDRETGRITEVADEITPSFFWSPDGSRLLYLYPALVDGRIWFRWGVWDGESTFSTALFAPSDVFAREYLSFFEQHAQSMSLWAPDGSAFVYAGSSESGESGVWIQPAVGGAEPVRVSDGVFATWSPA